MSKYAPSKKQEFVISEESAAAQLQEIIDYYDIEPEKMGEAEAGYEMALDAVKDAIQMGILEVSRDQNEKLVVHHHLKSGDKLTYVEVNAKAKMAMDKFGRSENYRRLYAFMGSLCGLGSAAIEKLPSRDLGVAEVLATVFSNV